MIAGALATNLGYNMMALKGSDIISECVGNNLLLKLKVAFEVAMAYGPIILFFSKLKITIGIFVLTSYYNL
jgi:AAA+ superfamily predicted ATPase